MLVVDFQGIRKNNKFYFKEFAINYNNEYKNYFLTGPSGWLSAHDYRQYRWLLKFHHGILHDYGTDRFRVIILPKETIYVKGEEKRRILSKYVKNKICNIELLGCRYLEIDKSIDCEFAPHNNLKCHFCSLKKAHAITKWLEQL